MVVNINLIYEKAKEKRFVKFPKIGPEAAATFASVAAPF
jgi:hypothetical protein